MYYDRFDIVQAHYWHAVNYHTGMSSDLYLKQCRISRYYRPSPLENGPSTENAREIYTQLTRQS